jgi:hypothetical protein
MVQITGQEVFNRERERERNRPNPVNTLNPGYLNTVASVMPLNYAKGQTPAVRTLYNYTLPQPPPPPTPPPPMFPRVVNLGNSYPSPAPRCYPPVILGNTPSYPPMYFGPPQCLMNTYQEGVKYAQPALPDPSINPRTALCSLHGKRRTLAYLTKNKNGNYECTSASVCKTVPSSSTALCAIHGKRRSMQNLIKNSAGDLVCESHDECIVISDSSAYKQICSAHGKLRSLTHLVQTSPGVFVCGTGSICF